MFLKVLILCIVFVQQGMRTKRWLFQVNFLYNGGELMLSKNTTDTKYVLERSEADDGGVVFTLTVTNMTEEDCGVYTCVSREHPEHVLQETSVSLLGEGVTFFGGKKSNESVINI